MAQGFLEIPVVGIKHVAERSQQAERQQHGHAKEDGGLHGHPAPRFAHCVRHPRDERPAARSGIGDGVAHDLFDCPVRREEALAQAKPRHRPAFAEFDHVTMCQRGHGHLLAIDPEVAATDCLDPEAAVGPGQPGHVTRARYGRAAPGQARHAVRSDRDDLLIFGKPQDGAPRRARQVFQKGPDIVILRALGTRPVYVVWLAHVRHGSGAVPVAATFVPPEPLSVHIGSENTPRGPRGSTR